MKPNVLRLMCLIDFYIVTQNEFCIFNHEKEFWLFKEFKINNYIISLTIKTLKGSTKYVNIN